MSATASGQLLIACRPSVNKSLLSHHCRGDGGGDTAASPSACDCEHSSRVLLVFLFGGVTLFIIGLHIKWIPRANFDSISQPFGLSTINVRAVKVFSKATTPTTSDEVAMATRTLTRNPKRTSAVTKPEVSGDVRSTSNVSNPRVSPHRNGQLPDCQHPLVSASHILTCFPSSFARKLTYDQVFQLLINTAKDFVGDRRWNSIQDFTNSGAAVGSASADQSQAASAGESQKDYVDRCRMSFNIVEKSCCFYDPRLVNLEADKDYKIGLYLQSWKYFRNYEDQIRQAMTFNADVTSAANETVSALRAKGRKFLVGVHVRRGDYLLKKHVEMGYKAASASYLRTAWTTSGSGWNQMLPS
ncbi:hypothetical protein C0Q70_07531 [Pomacea canaliculata]|uniref:L-Fucosyltransferase n=1 Tax=Pomacea canaliculata TaxID=400727 RepID=A0A2T7PFC4_POMCA|nr:hypothetical protein C0Q70_07531 [Pomacea canaliculata]